MARTIIFFSWAVCGKYYAFGWQCFMFKWVWKPTTDHTPVHNREFGYKKYNSSLIYIFLPFCNYNRLVPALFVHQLESYIDLVKHILLQALLSQHISLSEEAFTATCGFIVSAEIPVLRLGLEELLEPMLNVRTERIRAGTCNGNRRFEMSTWNGNGDPETRIGAPGMGTETLEWI